MEKKTEAKTPIVTPEIMREILENCSRFNVLGETVYGFIIWDRYENEHLIRYDWTIKRLINFINTHYYEYGKIDGKTSIQNGIKNLLEIN